MQTAERQHTGHNDERSDTEDDLTIGSFLDGATADLRGYVNAQRDHLLMKASYKFATVVAKAVHSGALLGGFAIALVFLNVALALYLGEQLGSYPLGFLLTALLTLIMVGLFHLWWTNGGRDRYLLARINDMNNDEDEV